MTSPPPEKPNKDGQSDNAKPLSKDYSGLAKRASEIFIARGIRLDFSPESLDTLDKWMNTRWSETGLAPDDPKWMPNKEDAVVINQLGCYIGECVIKGLVGTWKEECNKSPFPYSVGVLLPNGSQPALPFMAVYKRIRHGSSQSIKKWHATVTAASNQAAAQSMLNVKPDAQARSSTPKPTAQPPQSAPVNDVMARAKELKFKSADFARQGNFIAAIKCCDEALALSRSLPDIWSNKGTCLLALGRNNEALACFDKAVEVNPFYASGWFSKGVAEGNLSLNERAMASLQFFMCIASPSSADDAAMIETAKMALNEIEKRGVRRNNPQAVALAFESYNLAVDAQFDKSLALITQATALAPRLSNAWQYMAMCLNSMSRYDEAIKSYTRALEIEPRNAVFWYNKACIFGRLKRYDEALRAYTKTTECDPSYLEAWSNKGRLLGTLKKHEESIACLERAIELGPSAEAWLNKALSEDEIGRKARARASYEKFLELARPEHEMQINIARKRVSELGGQPVPGPAANQKPAAGAARTNPAEAEAWNKKGIDLFKADKLEDALRCFDQAILLDPDSVRALYNKAMTLDDLGRHDSALSCYSRTLEIDPSLAGAWLNKGALLNQMGQMGQTKILEEAAVCFDKAVELDPGQLIAWYNRGKNFADLGRDADAVRCYERAIDIDPDDANSWNNIGGCHLRLGKPEKALASFDRTISINPSHAFGWGNRGEALNKLRRFEEAIKAFDTALTIKTFGQPLCGKGTSLRFLGRLKEAIVEYAKAVDHFKEYSEAWRGKALCEDKLGLKVDAVTSYKRFLSCASKKTETKEITAARERLMELGVSMDEIEKAAQPAPAVKTRTPPPMTGTGWFIGQKYEVFKELGKGGFGVVYHVYSHETNAIYALKTFRDEFMKDDGTRKLFLKEAQTLIDMDPHPFLVEDYFIDEIGGRAYIAMEYIAPDEYGLNTLTSYLQRRPPDLAQSLRWAIQFCHGIEFVYSQGIRCHRDIKPDNIMVNQQKTIKIADFGLAGLIDSIQAISDAGEVVITGGGAGQTMRGASFGTPTHMPPEQFVNAADCDERSDIYSFGVCLYQMASGGAYPFLAPVPKDNSPKEANRFWDEMHSMHLRNMIPLLNSPLFTIIERCMAKRPEDRYQSFAVLRAECEPLLYKISGETVTVPAREEMNAAEWLNKGLSLKNLGRLDEAIASYDKAIELKPSNKTASVALSNKGNCLHLLGKLEDSLVCYAEALKLDPKNEKAWCNKGYVLQQQGKSQEALACYDRSIEISPDFAIAWNNKAFSYLSLSDYKKVVECADMAIRYSPGEDAAWVNKGAGLYAQNLNKEALVCYKQALEINPRQDVAAYNKGLCLHDLGLFQDAVTAFDRVIELNPKYESAWNGRGNALMRLKKYTEALNSLDKALELNPKYATPWYYKGYIMIYLKKTSDAVKCFRQFIQMAGDRQKVQVDDARTRLKSMGERI